MTQTQDSESYDGLKKKKNIDDFVNSENEKAMKAEYFKKTGNILANEKGYGKPNAMMGLELEVQVVDKESLEPASELVRNKLIEKENEFFDKELGAAQLEIRTPPYKLSEGLENMTKGLEERINTGKKILDENFGSKYGLLMIGMHPTADVKNVKRSTEDRYKRVPNFHNDYKGSHIETFIGKENLIDAKDAAIIGLANSIQCNIDAKNFKDAIEKLNLSFMIGNYVTAITSNSRFIDGKDSGLADTRMIAWEKSHDTRTPYQIGNGEVLRIGLPKEYDSGIAGYFQRVAKHPFILNDEGKLGKALDIGLGLNWNDSRIKIKDDTKSILVEFRPVSTQPTAKENVSAMSFYMGLLTYYQEMYQNGKVGLIPFDMVRENRSAVMDNGLAAKVYYSDSNNTIKYDSVSKLLPGEIGKAKQGLKKLGVNEKEINEYMSLLECRLRVGTPSDQLASAIYLNKSNGKEGRDAIIYAVKDKKLVI